MDRSGYSEAWYYERLTAYYENNLATTPRVKLRAVRELVGVPAVLPNGVEGHVDIFRDDIELFFASPVTLEENRNNIIRTAVSETCPQTNLEGITNLVVYFDDTYVVLQGISCLGHAS